MNLTWLYVALVYAFAIFIARRVGANVPWRIAALFYALVLVFFFRPMTQNSVNVTVDFLGLLTPWGHIEHVQPANREANDVPLQMVPWAHAVREQWKAFQLPIWNPFAASGSILLGNGQSAAFSPIRLLALPLTLGRAFTAEAAIKILMASTFMFLFCRRRYSETASAAGGIAYGFCTFIVCWLHFPHATVASHVPAALLAADMLAERITARRIALGGAVWGSILLGGHPETATHIFFLTSLMVLWILVVERSHGVRAAGRLIGACALMMFLALLIASPFLVAFAEAITKSQRYQQLKAHPNPPLFTHFSYAVALIQPHFFGPMEQEKWGPAGAETASGFAGILGIAGWVALLVDTMLSKRWRSREAFFVLAVPLLLGIMFDWPLIGSAFHKVLAMAANARVRVLLCFVLAVLTAAAIDLAERRRALPLLAGAAIASAILGMLVYTTQFPTAWAHDNTILAMLPSILVLAVVAWLAMRPGFASTVAVVAAIAIEMFAAGKYWNPVLPERLMYPMTPAIQTVVDAVRRSNPPFRIVGMGATLFPNTSAIYGLEDIRAHDPMSNGRYLGMLRVLTGYETDDYFAHWLNHDTTLLDYLNVRYVMTEPDKELPEGRYRKMYEGKDGRVYENTAVLPRFFAARNVILEFNRTAFIKQLMKHASWKDTVLVNTLPVENDQMRTDLLSPRPLHSPEASVHITKASATDFSMKVQAPRYSVVVSSLPFWPGWRVRMNGKTILTRPVNGAFIGFTVPPGTWDVRVDYFPLPVYVATAVSLSTLVAMLAVCVAPATARARSGVRKTRSADDAIQNAGAGS